MQFDLRETDLAKLNSLTKYPSIPTYHALDPKNGSLLEQVTTSSRSGGAPCPAQCVESADRAHK